MLPSIVANNMAKYNANKIPYNRQEELMDHFCSVLHKLKSSEEIKLFLKDLLNRHERVMLVRRLLIAELLLKELTYREIQEKLHVSHGTIARVERWLNFGRNGYRKAIG